jgi:hypothetical protein
MTTLFDVLKNTYLSLGQLEVTTATGGSVSTAIDTKLADKYDDDGLLGGTLFVIRDAAGAGAAPQGEAQRISANVQDTQTITVDTNFTAAIATGDTIGIAKNVYPLNTLIELANRALANLGTIQLIDTSITTTVDTDDYALPVALKYKPVRVQISDAQLDEYADIPSWYITPAAAGSTGRITFPFELPANRTIKLWYEAEHPRLSTMSDIVSETLHSELVNALLVEKALQWQNDRKNGQDTYMLQRLNKASADLEEARRRFAPQKINKIKYLTGHRSGSVRNEDVTKMRLQ